MSTFLHGLKNAPKFVTGLATKLASHKFLALVCVTSGLGATIRPSTSFAWGQLGHKVTAEISYRRLSPAAKAKIREILGSADYDDSSVWADQIKRANEWKHVSTYHYSGVGDDGNYLDTLASLSQDEQKRGEVLLAILKAETVLRDRASSVKSKAFALKFLVHFIGDLHQPLHTGRNEDRGGNDLRVNWYGKQSNLHAVWDYGMIESAHPELKSKSEREQINTYANYLDSKFGAKDSGCTYDLLGWFNQSLSSRTVSYANWDSDNDAYTAASLPVLEKQLALGGQHLACVLNSALVDPIAPPQETDLLNQVNRVLKMPIDVIIALEPSFNGPGDGERFVELAPHFDRDEIDDCH